MSQALKYTTATPNQYKTMSGTDTKKCVRICSWSEGQPVKPSCPAGYTLRDNECIPPGFCQTSNKRKLATLPPSSKSWSNVTGYEGCQGKTSAECHNLIIGGMSGNDLKANCQRPQNLQTCNTSYIYTPCDTQPPLPPGGGWGMGLGGYEK